MKFACAQDDLLKTIQTVSNVVPAKSTLPILSNILLKTEKDRIKFVANDTEVGLQCYMKAEILEKGETTVPAKKLGEIVKELPPKELEVSVNDGQQMSIAYEKGNIRLFGLPIDDFPLLLEFKEEKSIRIPQKLLREVITKIDFAISHDSTRYVLNGAYLLIEQKKMTWVATDGYRLALVEKTLDAPAKEKRSVIIPSKAMTELGRLLKDQGDVRIDIQDSQVLFQLEDMLLTSRLIEGQFPNYEQVIPKKNDKRVHLATDPFLKAVRRVSVFSTDKGSSIKMEIQKGKMLVNSSAMELGEAQEEVPVKYDGASLAVAYNSRYLMDVLSSAGEPEIVMELSEPLNPVIIRPESGSGYLCVIMPIRV